jgi:hypothetical protein
MDIARKLAAEALSLAAEWEANPDRKIRPCRLSAPRSSASNRAGS